MCTKGFIRTFILSLLVSNNLTLSSYHMSSHYMHVYHISMHRSSSHVKETRRLYTTGAKSGLLEDILSSRYLISDKLNDHVIAVNTKASKKNGKKIKILMQRPFYPA